MWVPTDNPNMMDRSNPRIAIVTGEAVTDGNHLGTANGGTAAGETTPELTDDGRALATELDDRGYRAEPVVWFASDAEWRAFDALVLRSCFRYFERIEAFRDWLAAVEAADVELVNPPDVVRWNVHKGYLTDLADAGVPIPPTDVIERGSDVELRTVLDRNGWPEAVVKPAVGTSSNAVWRCSIDEAAGRQDRFASLLADGDVLVQEFLPSVADGEASLVFFAGEYAYASRTVPAPNDFRAHHRFGAQTEHIEPSTDVIERAGVTLAAAADACGRDPSALPYARVDGVVDDGTFRVLEIELVEPYLGLARAEGAAKRFVDALEGVLDDDGPVGQVREVQQR